MVGKTLVYSRLRAEVISPEYLVHSTKQAKGYRPSHNPKRFVFTKFRNNKKARRSRPLNLRFCRFFLLTSLLLAFPVTCCLWPLTYFAVAFAFAFPNLLTTDSLTLSHSHARSR